MNPKSRRLFACHMCESDGNWRAESIRVTESQQMRRVAGRQVLHADVRCETCGHRWWSRHPEALARSRAADAEAAKGVT